MGYMLADYKHNIGLPFAESQVFFLNSRFILTLKDLCIDV